MWMAGPTESPLQRYCQEEGTWMCDSRWFSHSNHAQRQSTCSRWCQTWTPAKNPNIPCTAMNWTTVKVKSNDLPLPVKRSTSLHPVDSETFQKSRTSQRTFEPLCLQIFNFVISWERLWKPVASSSSKSRYISSSSSGQYSFISTLSLCHTQNALAQITNLFLI